MKKLIFIPLLFVSTSSFALDCSGVSLKEIVNRDFLYIGSLQEKTDYFSKENGFVVLKNTMKVEKKLKGTPISKIVFTNKPDSNYDDTKSFGYDYDYSLSYQIEKNKKYLISGYNDSPNYYGLCGDKVIDINSPLFAKIKKLLNVN